LAKARRSLSAGSATEGSHLFDYRALLREEKGRLDFVDICTPPCDHAPIAMEALQQGYTCFVKATDDND